MSYSSSSITMLSLIILSILNLSANPTTARTATNHFHPRALVIPVTKDPSTGQYLTTIFQRTPLKGVKLILDIGGKSLAVACDRAEYNSTTYRPALCHSPQCRAANSKSCDSCWDGPRPGCNNNTCSIINYNTVDRSAQIGELATDVLVLQSTDGSNPGRVIRVRDMLFSCSSLFLVEEMAKGVKGFAGFGRTETSLPSLFSKSLKIEKKFAICLSSSSKGVVFIGNGPYKMQPSVTISDRLMYTPLLVNPITTAYPIIDHFRDPAQSGPSMEYFIGVQSVKINGKIVPLSPNLLKIDAKGNGGTKISTVAPYTVMQTSVYKAVTKAFTEAIAKVPRVGPVAPFGGPCYKAASLGSTRLGPGVPQIELVLGNNATWTIFGANSMVYVNKGEVVCLGIVDGGKKARTSIVIGGHQLEDNLLEFDVGRSRLGFSSTLLGRQTTCANFNFTSM